MYNLVQIGIFLFFFYNFQKKKKLFGASYIKKKKFQCL